MLERIGVEDAVHARRLEDDLGADLHGAETRGRVGGEEGVAGAGSEDDHAALLEVPRRAAADVGLGDLLHLDGGEHERRKAAIIARDISTLRVDARGGLTLYMSGCAR